MNKFVPGISESINLCNFKVVPEGRQQNAFSKQFFWSQNTVYTMRCIAFI
jgi:hypothetical protein